MSETKYRRYYRKDERFNVGLSMVSFSPPTNISSHIANNPRLLFFFQLGLVSMVSVKDQPSYKKSQGGR